MLAPDALPALRAGLKDDDGAVRYWAALGILMRGEGAVHAARADLSTALGDRAPSVRVVAAWALGLHGDADELRAALAVLGALAPPDTNGVYVSLAAVNAIDALGAKAAPLTDALARMPVKDPAAPARANGEVTRIVERLTKAGSR